MKKVGRPPKIPSNFLELQERILALYVDEKRSVTYICTIFKSEGVEISSNQIVKFLKQKNVARSAISASKIIKPWQTRICKHCLQSYFNTNNAQVYCRICCPTKIAYRRLQNYNLSQIEFDELLIKQKGLCALCDEILTQSGATELNVDHCHITLKVRGLLCFRCNIILGFVDKNWANRLYRITQYLNKDIS